MPPSSLRRPARSLRARLASRTCLVGILTNGTKDASAPFGSRTSLLRDILSAAHAPIIAFAFTPSDVHWSTRTVLGTFALPDGQWRRSRVPLPDVVYNRIARRDADHAPAIVALKTRFLRLRVPFFNWCFFRKSDIIRKLATDAVVGAHIPDTVIDPRPSSLHHLLRTYRTVYVKPSSGSLGKGIVRVSQTNKGYTLRMRSGGQNVIRSVPTIDRLWHTLARNHAQMRGTIAQQGIRLMTVEDQPVDFRVHLVRDEKNNWAIGGIGAKKAGKGSITTHIRNGGTLLTPEFALWNAFGDKSERLFNELKRTSIAISERIAHHSRHHIAELGLDIGIDAQQRLWMFEANAKPGRSIFKHPALKEDGKRTTELLFAHCAHIARLRKRRTPR
jgi:hypothetical protein